MSQNQEPIIPKGWKPYRKFTAKKQKNGQLTDLKPFNREKPIYLSENDANIFNAQRLNTGVFLAPDGKDVELGEKDGKQDFIIKEKKTRSPKEQ